MKERISIILAILVSCCACPAFAAVYNVPGDSVTIQGGIDLASYGDTVQIAAGTYVENITLKNGVALIGEVIGSAPNNTIIDGNASGSVVTANSCDQNTVLDGFTITNGDAEFGGGMYNTSGSPTVTNCTFSGNIVDFYGGGMFNNNGSPTVTNCAFSGNSASFGGGGGMYNGVGSPTVSNCTFSGNSADNSGAGSGGGGMYNQNSSPAVNGCTFSGNTAPLIGGGMYNDDSSPTVTNCILWGNTAFSGAQIYGSAVVTYSDIQGGFGGTGNINADPLFIDADGSDGIVGNEDDDLRLQAGSSCIDAGNNSAVPAGVTTDLDGKPRFLDDTGTADTGSGTPPIVDMGSYEYGLVFVDASAELFGDGATWGTAYKYLADGLADAQSSGLDIFVAEGTYYPDEDEGGNVTPGARAETFALINSVSIYGGYKTGGTYVRDPNRYETILSGDLNEDDGPDFANNDENSYHVVTGSTITDPNTILDGFTITAGNANGSGPDDDGGGMYNDSGSPTVISCTFSGNSAFTGGGMYNSNSSNPIVTNCRFTGNVTSGAGGGMYNSDSSPTVTNSIFTGNSADFSGGGMQNWNSSNPTVTNCTFSGNSADNGGGMRNVNSIPLMTNCILWANTADNSNEIYNNSSTPVISYCDIAGCGGSGAWDSSFGTDGGGNIDDDPLFKDADGNDDDDFQLAYDSPCIDAADNDAVPADTADLDSDGDTAERTPLDLVGNDRFFEDPTVPDTGTGTPPIVDMGAYERYEYCGDAGHPYPPGDENGDCVFDLTDLAISVAYWLQYTGPE